MQCYAASSGRAPLPAEMRLPQITTKPSRSQVRSALHSPSQIAPALHTTYQHLITTTSLTTRLDLIPPPLPAPPRLALTGLRTPMVKKPTALAAPAAPSSNWKALKSALNPSAAPVAGAKRKRSEGLNSKGKEKARTKEEEVEELARAKGAESKGKRKELPIMELLEGKTEKWQEE